MATEIVVDSANWPVNIVRVRGIPGAPIERAAIEKLCASLASFIARKEPYANIIDLTWQHPVGSPDELLATRAAVLSRAARGAAPPA